MWNKIRLSGISGIIIAMIALMATQAVAQVTGPTPLSLGRYRILVRDTTGTQGWMWGGNFVGIEDLIDSLAVRDDSLAAHRVTILANQADILALELRFESDSSGVFSSLAQKVELAVMNDSLADLRSAITQNALDIVGIDTSSVRTLRDTVVTNIADIAANTAAIAGIPGPVYTLTWLQDGSGSIGYDAATASDSLQKGLDSLTVRGGGILAIGYGTYELKDSVYINSNHISIVGAGLYQTNFICSGLDIYTFVDTLGVKGIEFTNIGFVGTDSTAGAIRGINGTDSVRIENNRFSGFTQSGVSIISNDTLSGAWTISDNLMQNNYSFTNKGFDAVIANNQIYNHAKYGILTNTGFVQCVNNKIRNVPVGTAVDTTYGIKSTPYGGGNAWNRASGYNFGQWLVSGNMISPVDSSSCFVGINYIPRAGLYSLDGTISNNIISGRQSTYKGRGIYVGDAGKISQYVTLEGNIIRHLYTGIKIEGNYKSVHGGMIHECTQSVYIAGNYNTVIGTSFMSYTTGLTIASGDKNGYEALKLMAGTTDISDSGTNTRAGSTSGVINDN